MKFDEPEYIEGLGIFCRYIKNYADTPVMEFWDTQHGGWFEFTSTYADIRTLIEPEAEPEEHLTLAERRIEAAAEYGMNNQDRAEYPVEEGLAFDA